MPPAKPHPHTLYRLDETVEVATAPTSPITLYFRLTKCVMIISWG